MERGRDRKAFEEIIADSVPNLMKNIALQVQEAQQTPSRINKQIFTKIHCSHIVERQRQREHREDWLWGLKKTDKATVSGSSSWVEFVIYEMGRLGRNNLLVRSARLAKSSLILLDIHMATSSWQSDESGVQCKSFKLYPPIMKLSRTKM